MKLSIIIPTLNEQEYLPLLLKEIKKQDFKDLEVIVADAGSEDKTIEIAQGFGCNIVRGGLPGKGRNQGARIAKGDLLLFMDADNIFLPPGFLHKLVSDFEKRELDVASFPIYTDSNSFLDKLIYYFYNKWADLAQSFLAYAYNSALIKKELHEKINGFDESIRLAEDQEYVRRAKQHGKFGFINTEPVLTSARRLEKEGRIRAYTKYLLAGIWMFFFGPVRTDVFKYKFYNSLRKNK